jgi:hypothetical protein
LRPVVGCGSVASAGASGLAPRPRTVPGLRLAPGLAPCRRPRLRRVGGCLRASTASWGGTGAPACAGTRVPPSSAAPSPRRVPRHRVDLAGLRTPGRTGTAGRRGHPAPWRRHGSTLSARAVHDDRSLRALHGRQRHETRANRSRTGPLCMASPAAKPRLQHRSRDDPGALAASRPMNREARVGGIAAPPARRLAQAEACGATPNWLGRCGVPTARVAPAAPPLVLARGRRPGCPGVGSRAME